MAAGEGKQDPHTTKRPERASAGRAEGHSGRLHKTWGTIHVLQTPGRRLKQPDIAEYPTFRRPHLQS